MKLLFLDMGFKVAACVPTAQLHVKWHLSCKIITYYTGQQQKTHCLYPEEVNLVQLT